MQSVFDFNGISVNAGGLTKKVVTAFKLTKISTVFY